MRRVVTMVAVAATGLVGLAMPANAAPPPAVEATVPAGFTDALIGNVSSPTTVVGLFDGRAVVLQKGGAVRIVRNGAVLSTPAITLDVCTGGERGLLGFAADPAFQVNGFVYIYYTRDTGPACSNRVSRFTMAPGTNTISASSELVLLDNLGAQTARENHNGGDLEVGNDGFLYVAVGDGACTVRLPISGGTCQGGNTNAQDLSLLLGKILRVDRITGAAAPGNPFLGTPGSVACRTRGNNPSTPTTGPCREIFAYGLRNPWRFAFDQNTGGTRFFINDVGEGKREEIDLGVNGANYGWPEREGKCAQTFSSASETCPGPDPSDGYTQPIASYAHNEANPTFIGEYITGGAFVPNGGWPPAYDGGYFFSDGNPGGIWFRSAAGEIAYNEPFADSTGSINDLNFVIEPDGWALYYVTSNAVRKITPNNDPAPSPGHLSYTPLATSERAYDTRNLGSDTGPMRAGTSRLVSLDPPSDSAKAALVNITTVSPLATGYTVAWMPRSTRPATSNVNGTPGEAAANAAILPIDDDGNVILYSSVTGHVIVDVLGFFDTAGGAVAAGRFSPLAPVRAIDTRNPSGAGNAYTTSTDGGPGIVVDVPLRGSFGISSTGTDVSAVVAIVTAVAGGGPTGGYAVAYPSGAATPASSSVNTNGGNDVRANLVVVPIGADGSIDVRLVTVVDVVIDIVGVMTGSSSPSSTAGRYVPIAPIRGADSRVGQGFAKPAANSSVSLDLSEVPDDALAVAQNLTITGTPGQGHVRAYPTGLTPVPLVSNVNSTGPNQTRAAQAVTSLGSGSSSYFASISTHLVVDVAGYFTA